jgi:hypothetical protein
MATLENVNGASLVPSFDGGLNMLNQAFGQRMDRQRAQQAQQAQQQQIQQILGGGQGGQPGATPGFNGSVTPEQILRIGQIDPKMAEMMQGMLERNDKVEMEQAKAEVDRGTREATLISNAKTPAERMNVINNLAAAAAAEGRPVTRYVELMNMSPDQQELELQRMEVMGADIKTLLEPPKPPEIREFKEGDQIITKQLDPTTGQWTPIAEAQRFNPNAGAKVDVSVNTGTDKFVEEVAKGDASRFQEAATVGQNASRNQVRLNRLEDLLSKSGGGMGTQAKAIAGNFGIKTEGLDDIQAARALINTMVPEQRAPGSGTMSDADLELFKQALPSLINTPEGNQKIITTLRSINEYDRRIGSIASLAMSGDISRSEARQKMMEVPNPLVEFSSSGDDGGDEIESLVNKYAN